MGRQMGRRFCSWQGQQEGPQYSIHSYLINDTLYFYQTATSPTQSCDNHTPDLVSIAVCKIGLIGHSSETYKGVAVIQYTLPRRSALLSFQRDIVDSRRTCSFAGRNMERGWSRNAIPEVVG